MKTEEIYKKSLEPHKSYKGKIQVVSKVPFSGHADLTYYYYYTPGAWQPSPGWCKRNAIRGRGAERHAGEDCATHAPRRNHSG
ncbi:MAG: hypothetical protein ACUZ8A_09970 [Candidatus Bathyanammoxibius sp.]